MAKEPAKKKSDEASKKPKTNSADKEYMLKYAKRKYFYGTGRRKTAIARVRLYRGDGKIIVNDQEVEKYFRIGYWRDKVRAPLVTADKKDKYDVIVKVTGGGPVGQAEAVRLGVARALVVIDKDLRQALKDAGFLKRDPREKERKKPGLKRARRAPQWAKR